MYSTQKKAIYSSKMGKSWKNLVWKYGKNTEIEHQNSTLHFSPLPRLDAIFKYIGPNMYKLKVTKPEVERVYRF